jgi:NitT/TauT family transport system permease protein
MRVREYKRKKLLNKIYVHTIRIIMMVSFILLWQIASNKEWINSFLFSSPKDIFELLAKYISNGELFKHLSISLYETVLGLVIGTILGIAIAIVLWWNKFLSKVLDPFLVVLNALPKTALAPIFIIWVGTGIKGIVVVAISISLIVTILSAYSYFEGVDKNKIRMLESFGANKYQILTKLVLPSNLANIMGIIKINIGMSWIGVIVGEFIVSREGIGYLLTYGSQVFRLDLVMMSVFVLAIVAYLMYLITNFIESQIRKIYNK